MSESIGLGIAGFPFETSADFFKWVELCEAGDVDSIWTSDRLVSEAMNLEPLALMAVLAGATDRLQFGMNVVVLPFRDPLILAKQCATIDLFLLLVLVLLRYLSGQRQVVVRKDEVSKLMRCLRS
jgi:alkanesulfonate monooxygenase SsuD/methylene tetrahydromethanopterin reductase-like flavin-dependent oxidoreductase (luciferase family)